MSKLNIGMIVDTKRQIFDMYVVRGIHNLKHIACTAQNLRALYIIGRRLQHQALSITSNIKCASKQ